MPPIPVVIAWLDAADWTELRRRCPDLQARHDLWLATAEAIVRQLADGGHRVDKQLIRPADIDAFLAGNRGAATVNARDRSEIAVRLWRARQQH